MKHLKDVNKNYFTHMVSAIQIAVMCIIGGPLLGIIAIINAIVPFIATGTVSESVAKLHDQLRPFRVVVVPALRRAGTVEIHEHRVSMVDSAATHYNFWPCLPMSPHRSD